MPLLNAALIRSLHAACAVHNRDAPHLGQCSLSTYGRLVCTSLPHREQNFVHLIIANTTKASTGVRKTKRTGGVPVSAIVSRRANANRIKCPRYNFLFEGGLRSNT